MTDKPKEIIVKVIQVPAPRKPAKVPAWLLAISNMLTKGIID